MGAASNPCTGICKFSDGLCLSCGRQRSEKKQWKRLSKSQRKEVLARSAERIEALGDRAILSKKQRKKAKRRGTEVPASATVARFSPQEIEPAPAAETRRMPPPVMDTEAAREARKAWKKARKHARKAKKAAHKARAAEARARGLSAA